MAPNDFFLSLYIKMTWKKIGNKKKVFSHVGLHLKKMALAGKWGKNIKTTQNSPKPVCIEVVLQFWFGHPNCYFWYPPNLLNWGSVWGHGLCIVNQQKMYTTINKKHPNDMFWLFMIIITFMQVQYTLHIHIFATPMTQCWLCHDVDPWNPSSKYQMYVFMLVPLKHC